MKNKILVLGVAALVLGMLLVTAMPGNLGDNGKGKRVIADSTSPIDKFIFRMKGCTIVHELSDATALKCPVGVTISNAREDRIFHIVDLEADVQIHADDVWAQGVEGTGVNVAVLDTGIDLNHQELEGSYQGGYDYVDDDDTPEDWHGHGTHVSGIITADGVDGNAVDGNAIGVAPGAGIYMYKVCGTYGCYESDMMAAMEAAVAKKSEDPTLKVMSISIGGGNFAGEDCDSDPLAAKVNWVVNQGITVAVASGNDRYYVSSPACASGAIAVGAVDKSGEMYTYSNYGPALDIVAPGVSIYSSLPDDTYGSWTGTSMATPHVSGTVALMLEDNPDLTVDEIKTALYETADPINPTSVCYGATRRGRFYLIREVECTSDNYGAGIVDAYAALTYTTSTTTTTTPTTTTTTPTTTTTIGGEYCGNGYCAGADLGEDCYTCPTDCPSKTVGQNTWCCGDGTCSGKGENADNCPVDCAA